MSYRAVRFPTLLVAVGLLAACTDPVSPPQRASVESTGAELDVLPFCQLGCQDVDPNPSAYGVFLGDSITSDHCLEGDSWTDADGDSVADYCEKLVALAFAPELNWSYTYDDIRREPYWVAGEGDLTSIRVGYLLSYYYDLGSDHGICTVPGAHYLCLPHNGDSEAVFFDIKYNATTKHWVLREAWYLQHGTPVFYQVGTKGYAQGLSYPTHQGAHPRIFVAEDKHASYGQLSQCNGGGQFGTDTCANTNQAERLVISDAWNIGSRQAPFIDCVASRNPAYEFYGSGRTECFWTVKDFRGWVPDSIGGGYAGKYSDILDERGF